MGLPRLDARAVVFGYGHKPVLNEVSLRIQPGEIVSLLGPNGSGKTTLLKVLLGLYPPSAGSVRLDGTDLRELTPRMLARHVAYVPQTHRQSFAYDVSEVALMGRLPHKAFFSRYSAEDRAIALAALDRLGIAKLKDRPYTEISGGERQLTLIARALAQGANTLIMDEPLNGLDYGNQIRLLEQIASLAREGYTFVKSTHFPDHALWVADHVVLMRQGDIVADGPTDEVMTETGISRLYDAKITILNLRAGLRACFPSALLEGRSSLHPGNEAAPILRPDFQCRDACAGH